MFDARSAIGGATYRNGVKKAIRFDAAFGGGTIFHWHDAKGRPAAVKHRESRSFTDALDKFGQRSPQLFGVNCRFHTTLLLSSH
jgi:hypothetical protein